MRRYSCACEGCVIGSDCEQECATNEWKEFKLVLKTDKTPRKRRRAVLDDEPLGDGVAAPSRRTVRVVLERVELDVEPLGGGLDVSLPHIENVELL